MKKLHCTPRGQSFPKSSSHNPFSPLPCPGSINCSIFYTPTASVCTAILSFALLSYPQRSGSQLGTIGNVWRPFWMLQRWGFPGISSGEVRDAATYPTMRRRPHNIGLSDPNVKSAKGEKPCLGGIMWFNKRSFCFLPNKTRGKLRQICGNL